MKWNFFVPNYICLQNPWLGGYCPQIPVLSVLNWICWTVLPPNKIPGYATVIGTEQFEHTQMYKVTETIVIVFSIVHSALLVWNVDYQPLLCWWTCRCRWIINLSRTLVGKMWSRTELPTNESKECTCVWASIQWPLCWLLMAVCSLKKLISVSVFGQIGSKSCCLDSVLHLHLAVGWNWSSVESSSETPFWRLQEHMVEKPAVYS